MKRHLFHPVLSHIRTNSLKKSHTMFLVLFFILCSNSTLVMSQDDRGYFNSVTIGASASTTGIGFDLATPIGNHFALRAGINFMPNFKIKVNTEADIPYEDREYTTNIDVEGSFKRTSGEILLNIYPFKRGKWFLCGGFYLGGDRLLNIKAHTDNKELLALIEKGENVGIEIGDYNLPIDKNGNVSGGLKVASFRPYIGVGSGRVATRNRIGFSFEMGVQFHKSPKIYSNNGDISELTEGADDDFKKIMDSFNVYPVIKLRLCGRIL